MRILFFEHNPIWNYLLPEGFKKAGHEVFISGSMTPNDIPKIVHTYNPDLIITMGWGLYQDIYFQKAFFKYLKPLNIPHVYWSLEDPTFTDHFVLSLLKTVQPDFVFTICERKAKYFNDLGFPSAYMNYGYEPTLHHPVKKIPSYEHSIGIVANGYFEALHFMPYVLRVKCIKTLILPLLKNNIRIDFWGKDWGKMGNIIGYTIPKEWIHGPLAYTHCNEVYSSVDIMIGFQNECTQVTQRTFEVLGCEGFLITYDTPGVRNILKPGRDLVVSSSENETLSLIDYYLHHPKERLKIKKQGKKTITPYTYEKRACDMLKTLKDHHII